MNRALVVCFLAACGPAEKQDKEPDVYPVQEEKELDNQIPRKTLAVKPVLMQKEEEASPEDFFGKFHCDRASYYITNHPETKLFGAEVNRITHFYIDSTLLQTKYETRYDITLVLVWQLGSKCRIKALNDKNRKIIQYKWVLKKNADRWLLHPELDRYELIWRLPDKEVRYRVTEEGFVYYERNSQYEQLLKVLEQVCG